ncbi:hypothetical protein KIPB_005574, partial [Kipferlia bialata]
CDCKRPSSSLAWVLDSLVDEYISVPEELIAATAAHALVATRTLVEGSGALTLAAVLFRLVRVRPDEKVAVVVTGGNIEIQALLKCLKYGARALGSGFSIQLKLNNTPGQLQQIVSLAVRSSIQIRRVRYLERASELAPSRASIVVDCFSNGFGSQVRFLSAMATQLGIEATILGRKSVPQHNLIYREIDIRVRRLQDRQARALAQAETRWLEEEHKRREKADQVPPASEHVNTIRDNPSLTPRPSTPNPPLAKRPAGEGGSSVSPAPGVVDLTLEGEERGRERERDLPMPIGNQGGRDRQRPLPLSASVSARASSETSRPQAASSMAGFGNQEREREGEREREREEEQRQRASTHASPSSLRATLRPVEALKVRDLMRDRELVPVRDNGAVGDRIMLYHSSSVEKRREVEHQRRQVMKQIGKLARSHDDTATPAVDGTSTPAAKAPSDPSQSPTPEASVNARIGNGDVAMMTQQQRQRKRRPSLLGVSGSINRDRLPGMQRNGSDGRIALDSHMASLVRRHNPEDEDSHDTEASPELPED